MKYLEAGKIKASHGLKGEMKVKIITDDPRRFEAGKILYIGEEKERITVKNARMFGKDILLTLEGIDNIDDARSCSGKIIYVDVDEVREKGEIYYDDLIGCEVYDRRIKAGIVRDITEVPSGFLLRIEKENGKTVLVPYVASFVKKTDVEKKRIDIESIEGLL